ncbi:MAG TPA: chemotaxis protein CheA [Firmicutes bacterium]|jgi:two-component system chemotaxis sensor kinase CheA|nr:chemotaxis protein CheA [Bacillota bacterium]
MTDQDKNFIDEDLLSTFIIETFEQIERLVMILLQIEQNNHRQTEFIDEMFRLAHNIKGSSGVAGLSAVAEVMHEIENLFSAVRNGQYTLDNQAIDLLIDFCDEFSSYLKKEIMVISFDSEKWLNKLKSLKKHEPAQSAKENAVSPLTLTAEDKLKLHTWQNEGKKVYEIDLSFAPEAKMRSASVLIFLRFIRNYGRVFTTAPAEEAIPNENYSTFKIILVTENHLSEEDQNTIVSYPIGEEGNQINLRDWADKKKPNQRDAHPDKVQSSDHSFNRTIRVDTDRIDKVINQLGELITLKTSLFHLYKNGYKGKTTWEHFSRVLQELEQIVSSLQMSTMDLRMVPVHQLFTRFPKIVRDIAKERGKKVELHFVGADTEIDKHIAEELIDALTHLLRNSVDHGLEDLKEREALGKDPTGHITLSARQEGSHIVISVTDDGRGLNLERIREKALSTGLISENSRLSDEELIRLIFSPGFSTAENVSELSGRGVGMDVVKTNLKKLQGYIDVQTQPGQGTSFMLKVPLTLAIIQSFMVKVGGQTFGIPVTDVIQSIVIKEKEIHQIGAQRIYYRYPETIPLVHLGEYFGFPFPQDLNRIPVVIINYGRGHVGFIVEELIGIEDIMIKPINKAMGEQNQIAGAALLGNGNIGLILNHQQIAQQALKIN